MTCYRHAWDCRRCPQRNDEQGCPAWTELLESNTATGEERITKGCLFALLPRLLVEVLKASNRPAAAIESTRNEIAAGFDRLAASAAPALLSVLSSIPPPAAAALLSAAGAQAVHTSASLDDPSAPPA